MLVDIDLVPLNLQVVRIVLLTLGLILSLAGPVGNVVVGRDMENDVLLGNGCRNGSNVL